MCDIVKPVFTNGLDEISYVCYSQNYSLNINIVFKVCCLGILLFQFLIRRGDCEL